MYKKIGLDNLEHTKNITTNNSGKNITTNTNKESKLYGVQEEEIKKNI